ncbi:MAG: hypothetical protein A2W83_00350 [Sulfuricurvum sp. RIFCSPLOWO2_12_43_5]|nr:MAG: hypothetical protein A2W83_00350 [Sulfuricurvum sp. RIFCSPLOWO2_12_43_5]
MGMFIGFFLLIYIVVSIGVYKLTKRFSSDKRIHRVVLAIIFLIPTYDIIITNTLGAYHCLTTPSTYISKTVEYPESIYWEDNVYPGFNAEDRKLMIMNYLDGVHLKTMALNGEDGKIYVYEAKENDFKSFQYDKKFKDRYTQYASIIMKNEKICTKESMPKMNYTVTFDEIQLNALSRKFLYSDETKIIDNSTNETIAYNRRVMQFFYNALPDLVLGNMYYQQEPVCGDRVAHLEYKVFDAYKWSDIHLGSHQRNLHEILIKRNKGEK